MGLIVQKFGGSSVKDRDRIFNVARIVMNTRNAGNDVVVVVSAQGDTTDDLIAKAAEITSDPSHREMDMLLAAGEEISISLLTMALQELGVSAISLTGWRPGLQHRPCLLQGPHQAPGHRACRERTGPQPRGRCGGVPGPEPL